MYIIISIYSKNSNSLTNFLKFFYRLKKKKAFKLRLHSMQSQKKTKKTFFSTLQSPHVNKKSQEQFEYRLYHKKLKIHISQITKFLIIWKILKTLVFSDIKLKTKFCLNNKWFKFNLLSKIEYDKFRLKFLKKKLLYLVCFKQKYWSTKLTHTSLKLLDIYGEIGLKSL